MANRRTWELARVALLLYLLSLLLPAISVIDKPLFGSGDGSVRMWFGAQCLVAGWIVWPGWIANPLFALGYVLHRFDRHAAAAVVLLLAILSAILGLVILRDLDLMQLDDILVGYVVWLASIVVLLVAVISPPRFRATLVE